MRSNRRCSSIQVFLSKAPPLSGAFAVWKTGCRLQVTGCGLQVADYGEGSCFDRDLARRPADRDKAAMYGAQFRFRDRRATLRLRLLLYAVDTLRELIATRQRPQIRPNTRDACSCPLRVGRPVNFSSPSTWHPRKSCGGQSARHRATA